MDTKTSLFVVGLFAFVVAVGWATSEHGMCDYAVVKAVTADTTKDGAVNCFDYWLNRYQTFATQGVADIIAIIAGIFLFRQIGLTRDQTREAAQQSRSAAGALAIENIKFLIEHSKSSSELYGACFEARAYWLKFQYRVPTPNEETIDVEGFNEFAFKALQLSHEIADRVGNFAFVFVSRDLADALLALRKRAEDVAEYAERYQRFAEQRPRGLRRDVNRSSNFLKVCFTEACISYAEMLEAIDNECALTDEAISKVRGNFLSSINGHRE